MTQTPLNYAPPPDPTPARIARWEILCRIARGCALLPMFIGTIALIGCLSTDHSFFYWLALYTILAGTALVFLGLCCVAIHLAQHWPTANHPALLEHAAKLTLLLLSNFLLAFIYWAIVMAVVGGNLLTQYGGHPH